MRLFTLCYILLILFSASLPVSTEGQSRNKQFSFRDSLDHAFDLSDWIINANGFIPVPIIVTEPALGGFGLGFVPVFMKKNPPLQSQGRTVPVPPDMTVVAAAYTANKTWFTGIGRTATLDKLRMRYKAFIGYANINLDFYRETAQLGEMKFGFNGRSLPAYFYLAKQLTDARWLTGIQYLFVHTELKMQNEASLPDFVKDKEVKSNIGELGVLGEFDTRDNTFTPNKGLKAHAHINFSENFFGSDYSYQQINGFLYWYVPVWKQKSSGKSLVSGFRFDYQQMLGDPPFYAVPFIDLRGVPMARYQGNTNLIVETEQRWDFQRRWSAVAFGGLAKAFDHFDEFGDATLVYNYGAGFRYLVARKFQLRMGVDVARGPTTWAYYIIFGSSWGR
ncbi:BamA/TamA family outer membrane protein [Flavihumibacter solisilvae]|uniref:Bacterial surface antigen (D15) domain-containing protein n=1 Tax=Flavihumibacter solisilvae TaxID=1349421 RepID=A0A0C1IU36_9BACT|nr:BamA/TamA family outer membrane protein [Flavihumibacter solisilvae]KIC93964.1 hypothetical protein OI18_13040 [Flavihumibacter solisilvae]